MRGGREEEETGTMATSQEVEAAVEITIPPSSHAIHVNDALAGVPEADGKQTTHIAQNTESIIMENVADEASREVGHKVQSLVVPEVGMTFESEKKAYDMYNDYAGMVGFSVRRSNIKKRGDDSISHKYIVCSNEGHGPKSKRGTISLEKKIGKKKKNSKKKGEDSTNARKNRDEGVVVPEQSMDLTDGRIGPNITMPNFANDVYGQSSAMAAPLIHGGYVGATLPPFNMYGTPSTMGTPYMQGGYTSLLLGVDQAATMRQSPVRQLHFDVAPNNENM